MEESGSQRCGRGEGTFSVIENLMIGAGLAIVAGILSRLAPKAEGVAPVDLPKSGNGSARVMFLTVHRGSFMVRPVDGSPADAQAVLPCGPRE